MEKVTLKREAYNIVLKYHLFLLKTLISEKKEMNKIINKQMDNNHYYKLLKTIPGIGNIFASIIALEVDNINKFPSIKQFWAYSGLAPSTHSSGQTHYHGNLIKGNKWLRWAFVEASHTVNRVFIYFI